MAWMVSDQEFARERVELNGNKFLLSNGYMGYRGTLEEFTKEQYTGCILAGLYDQVGDKWREPVNAPNGLYVRIYSNGVPLTVMDTGAAEVIDHKQFLNIRDALHRRRTTFQVDDNIITVNSERFVSADNVHLLCLKYSFKGDKSCKIKIETGIDGDVWDINGPHLQDLKTEVIDNNIFLKAVTGELRNEIVTAERIELEFGRQKTARSSDKIMRIIELELEPGVEYSFVKYVSIYTASDQVSDLIGSCIDTLTDSYKSGYDRCFDEHKKIWADNWERSDVQIKGDPEGQLALRYSLYHLLAAAPTHSDSHSIPARGLSSQVYKGAVFWDTELYMLPFFIYTDPTVAKRMIEYRINSLDGARKKAREYGYRGAYYPWESQNNGDDACTNYGFNDVFTGRPIRTYFRDKQIHISADVVYGIWNYYRVTGDKGILLEGGAEVILESARFYYSYSYFNMDTGLYEILDVTGPDEYHERVNNNAYTNMMARYTVGVAIKVLDLIKTEDEGLYQELMEKLDYYDEYENIKDYYKKIYIPEPEAGSNIIEQFDGYFKLEDISLEELEERIIDPDEYLGGPVGPATGTQIIKQADTVLMLNQFKNIYPEEVKRANWDYYEPRTEHGSSLSPCVYAMQAAHLGKKEYAYKYFLKTAEIDLTGDYKQYVGDLFVGGTHLAANGGAWLAVISGFAGLELSGDKPEFNPVLPEKWDSIGFKLQIKGKKFKIEIVKDRAIVTEEDN